ncbi:hypothetical protein B0H63DRAFT_565697 [Podospora didyma]|uniref:Uncharacterized protein n=1 Tax=Podospora didyma TaxID=330526 RepID=A0AAE0N2K2_9PEZI|nr:hypothetical protein B0H63DRAFT_565697 [Podospora didyma]
MAYTGGIEYISLQFGGVDWEEIGSPWSSSSRSPECARLQDNGGDIALIASPRGYNMVEARPELLKFIWPGELPPLLQIGPTAGPPTTCVHMNDPFNTTLATERPEHVGPPHVTLEAALKAVPGGPTQSTLSHLMGNSSQSSQVAKALLQFQLPQEGVGKAAGKRPLNSAETKQAAKKPKTPRGSDQEASSVGARNSSPSLELSLSLPPIRYQLLPTSRAPLNETSSTPIPYTPKVVQTPAVTTSTSRAPSERQPTVTPSPARPSQPQIPVPSPPTTIIISEADVRNNAFIAQQLSQLPWKPLRRGNDECGDSSGSSRK